MSINEVVNEYLVLDEKEKALARRVKELKKMILEYAGENKAFETIDHYVAIEKSVSILFDSVRFCKEFPDAKKEYPKESVKHSIVAIAKEQEKTA